MAKSRMIRQAILGSEKVCSMSIKAQLFFFKLLLVADDFGLFDARAHILRGVLYSASLDKTSKSDIDCHLAECEKADIIVCYFVDDKRYGLIRGYGQRAQSDPKHPIPEGWTIVKGTNATINHGEPPLTTVNHGEPPLTTVNHGEPPLTTVENRENEVLLNINAVTENPPFSTVNHGEPPWKTAIVGVGVGVENGDGKEKPSFGGSKEKDQLPPIAEASMQAEADPRTAQKGLIFPKSPDEIEKYIANQRFIVIDPSNRKECAMRFFDDMEAVGWVDYKGRTIKNWQAAARAYAQRWEHNSHNNQSNSNNRKIIDANDFTV